MWEVLLIVAAVVAGIYALTKSIQGTNNRVRPAAPVSLRQGAAAAAMRWRQAQAADAKRRAARDMQLAIQQLQRSPDFRRAASFAARAARVGVPAAFRQRQFRRLRSLLVGHLAGRLRTGASLECSANGLRELLVSLAVAGYEADYIATEAQSGQRPRQERAAPTYRDRLRQLHSEHGQRLDAIRDTADLDDELREQLVEAEQERFRRELLEQPE